MTVLVAGLDLETTGFDPADGHRIVEVALMTYEYPSRKLVDAYVQRVDPDRNIPAAASNVHGIMYTDLVGMPKWEDVAPQVHKRLAAITVGVAHNAAFDGYFMGHELVRLGLELPEFELYCTMENARWATPDGKSPKLEELCFALNVPFERARAHGAQYDTQKMMECFFAGIDRGFYVVPELSPAALLKAA